MKSKKVHKGKTRNEKLNFIGDAMEDLIDAKEFVEQAERFLKNSTDDKARARNKFELKKAKEQLAMAKKHYKNTVAANPTGVRWFLKTFIPLTLFGIGSLYIYTNNLHLLAYNYLDNSIKGGTLERGQEVCKSYVIKKFPKANNFTFDFENHKKEGRQWLFKGKVSFKGPQDTQLDFICSLRRSLLKWEGFSETK